MNSKTTQVQADFSIALIQLKKGNKVARATWPEGQYVEIHEYADGIDVCLCKADGTVYSWDCLNESLLANDWVQVG